jgi:hypothetical protein
MASINDFAPRLFETPAVFPGTVTDSAAVDLMGTRIVGLVFPTPFAGTLCHILSVDDAGAFFTVTNAANVALSVVSGPNKVVTIDPSTTAGLRRVALRSNAALAAGLSQVSIRSVPI